jgi:DNA-directed RNA polymerase specialized sigma24 family protein
MTTNRERVLEAAHQHVADAWSRRDEEGVIEAANEVFSLTLTQLNDDVFTTAGNQRDRIGRPYVGHAEGSMMDAEEFRDFWPARSDDQLDLQAGFEPYLDKLEGEIRLVVREFAAGYTQHEIAERLGLSQPTIHRRWKAGVKQLQAMLLESLPEPTPEVTS